MGRSEGMRMIAAALRSTRGRGSLEDRMELAQGRKPWSASAASTVYTATKPVGASLPTTPALLSSATTTRIKHEMDREAEIRDPNHWLHSAATTSTADQPTFEQWHGELTKLGARLGVAAVNAKQKALEHMKAAMPKKPYIARPETLDLMAGVKHPVQGTLRYIAEHQRQLMGRRMKEVCDSRGWLHATAGSHGLQSHEWLEEAIHLSSWNRECFGSHRLYCDWIESKLRHWNVEDHEEFIAFVETPKITGAAVDEAHKIEIPAGMEIPETPVERQQRIAAEERGHQLRLEALRREREAEELRIAERREKDRLRAEAELAAAVDLEDERMGAW